MMFRHQSRQCAANDAVLQGALSPQFTPRASTFYQFILKHLPAQRQQRPQPVSRCVAMTSAPLGL